jgi:anti-sigma factor RsiW
MLSCREVSRLVAAGELGGQSLLRRVGVRLHLLTCDHCKRYARELEAIRAAARRLVASESFDPARLARLRESIVASLRGDKPE